MKSFVVDADAAQSVKRTRHGAYDPDFIANAVKLIRQVGATAAVAQMNKKNEGSVTVDAAKKWLSRWKKEGNFWEAEKRKRGRPNVLCSVAGAHEEWERQVEGLRAQKASRSLVEYLL